MVSFILLSKTIIVFNCVSIISLRDIFLIVAQHSAKLEKSETSLNIVHLSFNSLSTTL